MVAVQMFLMNYFLLGLHTESHFTNDVFQPEELKPCSLGCSRCSSFNGCFACKPPFLLTLHRDGVHQKGVCKRDCPKGFYGFYTGKEGVCVMCEIGGCKDCSSRHFCQECHIGRFLFNGRCKKKCPVGFPYDKRKNTCLHDIKDLNGTSKGFPLDRRKTAIQSVHYSTKKLLQQKKERRKLCRKNKMKERRRRKKNKRRRRMRLKKERNGGRKRSRRRHHRRKKRRKGKNRKKISFSKNNSTNPS